MNTEIIKISATSSSDEYKKAVELLKDNQVVGMPTETVYGLAGNAYSEKAVKRIFEAKGRPQDNPLIVHISEFSEIYDLVSEVPDIAKKLAEKYSADSIQQVIQDLSPSGHENKNYGKEIMQEIRAYGR